MPPVVAVLALAALAQDPGVTLRWKWTKGQDLRYRFLQKLDLGGSLKMEYGSVVALKVTGLDDQGRAAVEGKYAAVSFHASGNQECQYDSEKDKGVPTHPYARMVATLVGQTFTFRMTADGNPIDLKASDAILPTALKAGGEGEGGFGRQMIEHLLSDDFRKTQLQQLTPAMPAGKVAAGGSWTAEVRLKVPVLGVLRLKPKCTLAGLKEGAARVDQEIHIEYLPEDNPDNPFAALTELKSHKAAGGFDFLPDSGRCRSAKNKVELVLALSDKELALTLEYEATLVDPK
jgi:hypothetical protein